MGHQFAADTAPDREQAEGIANGGGANQRIVARSEEREAWNCLDTPRI